MKAFAIILVHTNERKVLFSVPFSIILSDDTISLANCKLSAENSSEDFPRGSFITKKIAGATCKIMTDSLVGVCLDNRRGYLS